MEKEKRKKFQKNIANFFQCAIINLYKYVGSPDGLPFLLKGERI